MNEKISISAIDIGKLICAYIVVAIHTQLLAEFGGGYYNKLLIFLFEFPVPYFLYAAVSSLE